MIYPETKAALVKAARKNGQTVSSFLILAGLEKAKESYWAGQAEIQRLEVNAWSSLTEGRKDLALTTMKSAAEMEDGTDKKAITPGPLAPARELFGEMLLEINQPTGGGAGGEQGSFGELVPDAEVRSGSAVQSV